MARPKVKSKAKPKAKPRAAKSPKVEKVIPLHMIPDVQSEVIKTAEGRYLQSNEAMFTFYKRSKGEQSPYFLGLMEKKQIIGARCPKCKLVRVPAFEIYCPDCQFEKLELVELPDTGVMNSTPPITYFANSLFAHMVPFGRGRVMIDGADTGIPMHVYTTKGVLTPRVFKKNTPVKVIFRKNRLGKPTDVFAVPIAELPEKLRAKKGVEEQELDWSRPVEPPVDKPTPETEKAFKSAFAAFQSMSKAVAKSDRAKKDLAGWKRSIQVKTAGGSFIISIDKQNLTVKPGKAKADFVMVSNNPRLFEDWMNSRESLTNAIIADKLWISKNQEFTTVFKLDRLPRSLRRT
ncbi:MAG: hypothetical protein PHE84_14780 [bacterium]|nr:hypothetical protein [bacterium]